MNQGSLISEQELSDTGWKHLTSFAHCEVWGKKKERILWERESGKIEMVYQNKDSIDGT